MNPTVGMPVKTVGIAHRPLTRKFWVGLAAILAICSLTWAYATRPQRVLTSGEKLLAFDNANKEVAPCMFLSDGAAHAAEARTEASGASLPCELSEKNANFTVAPLCMEHLQMYNAELKRRQETRSHGEEPSEDDFYISRQILANYKAYRYRFIQATTDKEDKALDLLEDVHNTYLPDERPDLVAKIERQSAARKQNVMNLDSVRQYMATYPTASQSAQPAQ